MAGLILLVLALGTLVGSVARGWWMGRKDDDFIPMRPQGS